ncbi:MAG: hypothetical protein M4579_001905 [Chaenotheca gracillima]|nr:MAG: hypothetical protein M4579_001905 [Chaenotheca gracillima]
MAGKRKKSGGKKKSNSKARSTSHSEHSNACSEEESTVSVQLDSQTQPSAVSRGELGGLLTHASWLVGDDELQYQESSTPSATSSGPASENSARQVSSDYESEPPQVLRESTVLSSTPSDVVQSIEVPELAEQVSSVTMGGKSKKSRRAKKSAADRVETTGASSSSTPLASQSSMSLTAPPSQASRDAENAERSRKRQEAIDQLLTSLNAVDALLTKTIAECDQQEAAMDKLIEETEEKIRAQEKREREELQKDGEEGGGTG